MHLKGMHVEATPHLHDILVVHLFNAGLPCMASARALDTTRPVASVTHWLPCEAVDSASDLSRRSHLLLLKLRGPYGVDCPCIARLYPPITHAQRMAYEQSMWEPAMCSTVGQGWYMGGPGLERVWNGMERGLERNGPLQHSTATTQHIFIKIRSLERE